MNYSNNITEIVTEQFFMVQNDGTFNLLTKPIHYVTQDATTIKSDGDIQSCAAYSAPSQQYYLNVDDKTEKLLLSDEYVSNSTDNNVCLNSYLPQSNESTNTNEITITDEQYQTLEQRGWISLESHDKIFLLNTSGLHDITVNTKLIEKLKNSSNNGVDPDLNSVMKTNVNNTDHFINDCETRGYILNNDNIINHNDNNNNSETENIEDTHMDISEDCDEIQEVKLEQVESDLISNADEDIIDGTVEVTKENNGSSYKIKTQLVFKDIPNKIVLGKTKNGKRLVAKVLEARKPETITEKVNENQQIYGKDLSNSQFIGLLRHILRTNVDSYTSEDIAAAEAVIEQLSKVPAVKQAILDQNLAITKVRNTKDYTGKLKSKLTLITGRVDSSEEKFTHIPNLLQYLIKKSDPNNEDIYAWGSGVDDTTNKDSITIYHLHDYETVCENNSLRVDMSLTKRQISVDHLLDRPVVKTYACSACAAIFNTADALKEHQETLCLVIENDLTIDTDTMESNTEETHYCIKESGKQIFCCQQCNAQFLKRSHCQKHIKTHFAPTHLLKSDNEDKSGIEKGKPSVYKCKMCPATFFVPSTLSRHILTKHIKLKTKLHQSHLVKL